MWQNLQCYHDELLSICLLQLMITSSGWTRRFTIPYGTSMRKEIEMCMTKVLPINTYIIGQLSKYPELLNLYLLAANEGDIKIQRFNDRCPNFKLF